MHREARKKRPDAGLGYGPRGSLEFNLVAARARVTSHEPTSGQTQELSPQF